MKVKRNYYLKPFPPHKGKFIKHTQSYHIVETAYEDGLSVFITQLQVIINNKTRSPKGLRVNSPLGEAKWAIDPWPLRAKGLIGLVSPN